MQPLSYLALGDSYTIGEQVPLHDSFPYQLIQLLRNKKQAYYFSAPEIIAQTGWTTDELKAKLSQTKSLPTYDFVTLLIGVNNQYRGRATANYKEEFEDLLNQAIGFAASKPNRVFVLSIPDWGITPFAVERDTNAIAKEIDAYNEVCRMITEKLHCRFIDITTSQRADGSHAEFLAADGLHPSGKEYAKWAEQLYKAISATL